jgi:putative transposase
MGTPIGGMRSALPSGKPTNRSGEALRDIVEPLKNMVSEMVEYALEHSASQKTLHRVFYERYRREYPWIPTRVIKGAYRDAVRRAKSFRERLKKGRAYTGKPEV